MWQWPSFFYLWTIYNVLYGVLLLPTQELAGIVALLFYRIKGLLAYLVRLDVQQVVSQLTAPESQLRLLST